MPNEHSSSLLAEAVLAVLAERDWQLHLPAFATVPFFGSESEFTAANGRNERGEPAFLQCSTQDALDQLIQGKIVEADSSSWRQVTTLDLENHAVKSASALDRLLLSPLRRAISLPEDADEAIESNANTDSPKLADELWSDAVCTMIHRFTLNPESGQLQWRARYFQFSLSKLVLKDCHLDSICLQALGSYLELNKSLIELDLSSNECLSDSTRNKAFAKSVSMSSLRKLNLAENRVRRADILASLLVNMHSDTLQHLHLSSVFVFKAHQHSTESDEELRRVAIVIAAFLRSCARARIVRLLLGQTFVEQALIDSGDSGGPPPCGCSALMTLNLIGDFLRSGEVCLIRGTWRLSGSYFEDHPNPLLARALPSTFCLDLIDAEMAQSKAPSLSELSAVFKLAANTGDELTSSSKFGATVQGALSDSSVQKLMQPASTAADYRAFCTIIVASLLKRASIPGEFEFDMGIFRSTGGLDIEILALRGPVRSQRKAAYHLLAATRVLACRARANKPNKTGWFSLPTDLRRACLESIPTLFIPSWGDIMTFLEIVSCHPTPAYLEWLQQHSVLSHRIISRIFSYAADSRTIGYALLPEATFLLLRIASDRTARQNDVRVLNEAPWSFAAAQRRWSPLDRQPSSEAEFHENDCVLSWEQAAFLRTIGFPEEIRELMPRAEEVTGAYM